MDLAKYPRTAHLEGSRLQPGDEDLAAVPLARIAGRHIVVEEKLDGANSALSFDDDGRLLLQSRGHYLTGGAREKHFALLKTWAAARQDVLRRRLGSRYVVYGEWLYAKHTVFYDALPHYFMEFDVLDRDSGEFLSTERRGELLGGLSLVSVPVLWSGTSSPRQRLDALIGHSLFKTPEWWGRLQAHATELGLDAQHVCDETDPSPLAEGLYLKVEEGGAVRERYKYIRASFLTSVLESGTHWLKRPIVPNLLATGVDLHAGDS
jgi:hypothetical protein